VVRTTVKTASDAQWRIGRELRRRLSEALAAAGMAGQLPANRVPLRPAGPDSADADTGQGGPT
jgi:small conductance mechanosensitive channel